MIFTLDDGTTAEASFYNGQPVLERGYALNILKGQRGVGKTFFYKLRGVMRGYFNPDKRMVWLRRYSTELGKKFNDKFFADLIRAANDPATDLKAEERKLLLKAKPEIKHGEIKLDAKTIGYIYPLSKSLGEKSNAFPDVSDLYFDEFLIKKGSPQHYIPDEFTLFMEFFSTVARTRRGFKAYLIGNNLSWTDPYSIALHIRPTNRRFTVVTNPINGKANVLMEMYMDAEFAKLMYRTPFGQIVQGSAYGDYAIENKSLSDNVEFVRAKSPKSTFRFAIKYEKNYYSFWIDPYEGYMYVTRGADLSCNRLYALTREDLSINTFLVNKRNSTAYFRELRFMYENACVFYQDEQVKSKCQEIFALII